jgi:uncharacterized membrane protein YbhN (UPF0104 family)
MEGSADTAPLPKASRRFEFLSIALSASLMVVGALVLYRWIDSNEIVETLRRLNWLWLVPALFVFWLQYPVSAVRFACVVRWLSPGPVPPFKLILKLTLSAGFLGVIAPVGALADVVKIGALRYFSRLPLSLSIRCILFDRVVTAQWLSLWALVTLPVQWAHGVPAGIIAIELLVSAAFLTGIAVLLILPTMLSGFSHHLVARFGALLSGYRAMLPWRRSVAIMVITLVNLSLVFATLYCVLRATELTANLLLILCFVPFLQIINSMPFLYMGWGGRELAMAATVGISSGLTFNQTLVVSAIWGIAAILTAAFNGVFLVGNWQAYREASKHAD